MKATVHLLRPIPKSEIATGIIRFTVRATSTTTPICQVIAARNPLAAVPNMKNTITLSS